MPEEKDTKYWKSIDELGNIAAVEPDESQPAVGQFDRRKFLKAAGFAMAVTALEGCAKLPVRKAIPYLMAPEEIIAGRAYYMNTTCGACAAGCGMVTKNRDGRPIKLEGNPGHLLSRGGLCAVGQASLLGLYDSKRLKHSLIQGKKAGCREADRKIISQLNEIRNKGGAVRFLTGTNSGPSMNRMVKEFLSGFEDGKHIVYDALSSAAISRAHEMTLGVRAVPRFFFDRAEIIVSFNADFLGTWISPVEYTAAYAAGRTLEGKQPAMSYHVQFEPIMTLTGTGADERRRVSPGEIGGVMMRLAASLARRARVPFPSVDSRGGPVSASEIESLAKRLWRARGKSLIVCGEQSVRIQALCNFMNHLLANYGRTIDLSHPSRQRLGDDAALSQLLGELHAGKVSALFIEGANPVYDLPDSEKLKTALKRVPLVVCLSERMDETAAAAGIVYPKSHYLEAWDDAEPVAGVLSVFQPAIPKIGNSRPRLEAIAAWMSKPAGALNIVRDTWRTDVFPLQSKFTDFQSFWDNALSEGFTSAARAAVSAKPFKSEMIPIQIDSHKSGDDALDLVLYPKVSMIDGRHAYNPWLQELPDPISKVTWDNYACVSPATAAKMNLSECDVVRLKSNNSLKMDLPVHIQPGQSDGVLAVALGYGVTASARFEKIGPQWLQSKPTVGKNGLVGINASPFLSFSDDMLQYVHHNVTVKNFGEGPPLACTQRHHTIEVPKKLAVPGGERRPNIQETTFSSYINDPRSGEIHRHGPEKSDLWPDDHPARGARWGMVIDLSACTGCSACVVACQAENNIPVVGKDEIHRSREMHWLRIDRYYSGGGENPDTAFQPMLCQQCGNAPCETVCPVLATVHSEEGLNQQVYNRCVGTRYCANNCPYKVRRFNWFTYRHDDKTENMALNPDVTVRMRGIMEKCTFCVQRIQEAKIEAKRKGVRVKDGDIMTACQQTCPARAITFGDLNDPGSRVAKLAASPRGYRVLEEIGVRPSVVYARIVRNRPGARRGKDGHGV